MLSIRPKEKEVYPNTNNNKAQKIENGNSFNNVLF